MTVTTDRGPTPDQGGDNRNTGKKLCHSWNQRGREVTVTVPLGCKVKSSDVDVALTEDGGDIKLKDGRWWRCAWSGRIVESQTKVQVRGQTLILKLEKQSDEEWAELERREQSETTAVKEDHVETRPMEAKDCSEDDEPKQPEEQAAPLEKEITHAQHDWFEKPPHTVNVNVYVKQIKKETVTVQFEENGIDIKFQTSDAKFLAMYPPCDGNSVFRWKLNLRNAIVAAECKFRVTAALIDITLRKRDAKRWTTLEAPSLPPPSDLEGDAPIYVRHSPPDTWLDIQPKKSAETEVTSSLPKTVTSSAPLIDGVKLKSEPSFMEKPTCMVSPLTKSDPSVKDSNVTSSGGLGTVALRGMTGLDNLGNTCFMNSVLQVLANTTELRDYFNESRFQKDINTDNPLGTGGKLVLAFAILLKILWSGKHTSFAPSKLKNLIALKATQFTGFAQHDAQEFMAYLLDGLHEDINRIKDKPYTQTVDSDGKTDREVAEESWSVYKQRNDSFIVDLFQGQYKSKLTCPTCNKVSITFDPFLYLSVPLPKKQKYFSVVFLYKESYKRPVRYWIRLPVDASVDQLKTALQQKTNVPAGDVLIFQSFRSKILKYFDKSSSLARVSGDDVIMACEVLSESLAGERVYHIPVMQRTQLPHQPATRCGYCRRECMPQAKLRRCTVCYKVAYCDPMCQRNHWSTHKLGCRLSPEPVGCPFIISLPESQATYRRLCQIMEEYARYSVDVFQPPVTPDTPTSPLLDQPGHVDPSLSQSERLDDSLSQSDSSSTSTLCEDQSETETSFIDPVGSPVDERKFMSPLVTPSISSEDVSRPPGSLGVGGVGAQRPRTMVLGTPQTRDRGPAVFDVRPVNEDGQSLSDSLPDMGDRVLDLSGYRMLSVDWKNHDRMNPYVLVQSKELDCDQVCPDDGREDGNVTIQQCLELFTEPEVLNPEEAWYCPRCKAHRAATKQMSVWRLPDTLIIQLKRFSFRNFIWRDKIDKMVDFPVRGLDLRPFCMGAQESGDNTIYDLYGVVNHHGGILGGHYTSYARCPDPKQPGTNECGWRLFDDSHVVSTTSRSVVTPAAYLLFYRRRQVAPQVPRPLAQQSAADEKVVPRHPGHIGPREHGFMEAADDDMNNISDEEDPMSQGSISSGFVSGGGDLGSSLSGCSVDFLGYTDMDSID